MLGESWRQVDDDLDRILRPIALTPPLPQATADEELKILLEANLLNQALDELGDQLNDRPAWLKIPLQGILQLLAGCSQLC